MHYKTSTNEYKSLTDSCNEYIVCIDCGQALLHKRPVHHLLSCDAALNIYASYSGCLISNPTKITGQSPEGGGTRGHLVFPVSSTVNAGANNYHSAGPLGFIQTTQKRKLNNVFINIS